MSNFQEWAEQNKENFPERLKHTEEIGLEPMLSLADDNLSLLKIRKPYHEFDDKR